MKTHRKVFKREHPDGGRVKVMAAHSLGGYTFHVLFCAKGCRTWKPVISAQDFPHVEQGSRGPLMEAARFQYVTPEQVAETYRELWESMKPPSAEELRQ